MSFSISDSRLNAAHMRPNSLQQLQGWRAALIQIVALAYPSRTFVVNVVNSYKDGEWLPFTIIAPRAFV